MLPEQVLDALAIQRTDVWSEASSAKELRRTRAYRFRSLDYSRGDFAFAEARDQVSIRVKYLDSAGRGIAIPIGSELDIARNLNFSGQGAVGVEAKELEGRREASPAETLPGSEAWTARGRRLVIRARKGAALMKHLICFKSLDDEAVAIRQRDL